MKNYMLGWMLLAMLPFSLVGCGGGGEEASNNPPANRNVEDASIPASAEAAPASQPEVEPVLLPPANATPEAVTQVFLQSLISGNQKLSSALFTDAARSQAEKRGWIMQPEGSKATFKVGQARYVSGPMGGAYVSTHLASDEASTNVEWILRQQPNGWRIAGIQHLNPETNEYVTFVFEDETDMDKMDTYNNAGGGAGAGQPAASTATAPTQPSGLNR